MKEILGLIINRRCFLWQINLREKVTAKAQFSMIKVVRDGDAK